MHAIHADYKERAKAIEEDKADGEIAEEGTSKKKNKKNRKKNKKKKAAEG